MSENIFTPDAEDVDFQKENLATLYRAGAARGINPRRKERIEEDIRFDDLASQVLGEGRLGEFIGCPFHGTDATPSFRIYLDHGFCFGCPPKRGYYDHIRFVKEYLGINWLQALNWIEKKFNLPPLANVALEEDEEEEEVVVTYDDLTSPFVKKARMDVGRTKDCELAIEYTHILFKSDSQIKAAKQWRREDAKEADNLRTEATKILARVVGQDAIDRILLDKEKETLYD
jgi:hypothetical protein